MTDKNKQASHIDINILNSFHYKTNIAIRFSDLNAFGMVNNDIYLSYFEIAQSGYWNNILKWKDRELGIMISNASVEYLHPVFQADLIEIYVRIVEIKNASFNMEYIITSKAIDTEKICTIGHTTGVFYNFREKKPQVFPEYVRNKIMEFEGI